MSSETLRVIDFGRVSPLRSQTLWHAIAHGVSPGDPPTLSLMETDSPYVSIGFHRRLDEVDREECQRSGIPIYRRMVGGGPVYVDDGQLLFQITLPVAETSPVRSRAVRALLEPAVDTFRAVGIDAVLEDGGDVVVGDRKVCGHGAGQIEQAVVMVGNLITKFDHHTAARIMAVPDELARAELEELMRRYVVATPIDRKTFAAALMHSYTSALGLEAAGGALNDEEERILEDLDAQFVEDEWLSGSTRPPPSTWQVKVKAGVVLAHATSGGSTACVGLASGRIIRVRLTDPALNGTAPHWEKAVNGLSPAQGIEVLNGAGLARLSKLFEDIDAVTST